MVFHEQLIDESLWFGLSLEVTVCSDTAFVLVGEMGNGYADRH